MCRDAQDPLYVYAWRLEQEASLRSTKGHGMTDEQVVAFVDGCTGELLFCVAQLMPIDYPSYELYTDRLRAGVFNEGKDRQLRLVLGKNRRIEKVIMI